MEAFAEDELVALERGHPEGITSEDILRLLSDHGVRFTEASLRKYIQLGLLPRSKRVALSKKSGKTRGSQGLYPATVIRRIVRLKTLMETYTIEQIQRDFLFVRGDVEELERTLERIFAALGSASRSKRFGGEATQRIVLKELAEARSIAAELVARITGVETRITMQARLEREAI